MKPPKFASMDGVALRLRGKKYNDGKNNYNTTN